MQNIKSKRKSSSVLKPTTHRLSRLRYQQRRPITSIIHKKSLVKRHYHQQQQQQQQQEQHQSLFTPSLSNISSSSTSTLSRTSLSNPKIISKQYFGTQPDRSHLKPLPTVITNTEQLDALHTHGNITTPTQLMERVNEVKRKHEEKIARQTKSANGKIKIGDAASNAQIENQIDEVSQAANITPPPTNLLRHLHSPYLLPMWDPQLRSNPELIASFENATKLPFESMDLIGDNLSMDTKMNLRDIIVQKNKITLLQVVSTQGPAEFASICADIWSQKFAQHGEFNQDGAILTQPIIANITEGFLQGLFRKSMNYKLSQTLSSSLVPNTISFHIKSSDDSISRARRFLNCRNRFVDNLFLIDERGLVRWQAQLATAPTTEFMDNLFNVTNDLILETKFDEAD